MFQSYTTKFKCSYMWREKTAIKNDILITCEDKNDILTCGTLSSSICYGTVCCTAYFYIIKKCTVYMEII